MTRTRKKALVLGIGNILLRDEGLGVKAIDFFEQTYDLPEGVSCVDGGTAGIKLLSLLKEFTHIIIIDAVASRKEKPGAIIRFGGKDLELVPPLKTTAHQLGVKDLLTLLKFEGHTPVVRIIGVVPEDISAGMELSQLIKKKLPGIAEAISEELEGFGFKAEKKKNA